MLLAKALEGAECGATVLGGSVDIFKRIAQDTKL
jgi:hypothetical protein